MVGDRDGDLGLAELNVPGLQVPYDRVVVEVPLAGEGVRRRASLVLRDQDVDLGGRQAALVLTRLPGWFLGRIAGVGVGVREDSRRLSPDELVPSLRQLARHI